ncbi:MAG: lysophospholipid acyltransferase family protein [Planctomycetota bacterium]|nr:lysophospholipid acyltransferase family protein [Planctomycetota bacterium]
MTSEQTATGFLLLVVVLLLLWAAREYVRSPFPPFKATLYFFNLLLTRLQWSACAPKSLPVDQERGAVIISNHRSSIDPFFVQMTTRRLIHWMVAREYCEHVAFGWFLRAVEAIPVNRGGIDTASTKSAIRYAERGGLVGMFPEGRINLTDDLLTTVRPGAILVALRAGVPLVPCYLQGVPYRGTTVSPFFMRAKVRVFYGEPIDLSEFQGRANDRELVGQLMLRCARALAQLAGEADFQPKLAGRKWKPEDPAAEATA